MGKRGPEPKGEFSSKGATLSARITTETRRRLDEACRASNRSISQEVETRLRRSFEADAGAPETAKRFGSQETYAVLRLAAEIIKEIEALTGQSWRRDRFTHNMAVDALQVLLDLCRPEGSDEPPETFPSLSFVEMWQPETKAAFRDQLLRHPLQNIVYPAVQTVGKRVVAATESDEDDKVYQHIADAIGRHFAKPLPLDADFVEPMPKASKASTRKGGSRK